MGQNDDGNRRTDVRTSAEFAALAVLFRNTAIEKGWSNEDVLKVLSTAMALTLMDGTTVRLTEPQRSALLQAWCADTSVLTSELIEYCGADGPRVIASDTSTRLTPPAALPPTRWIVYRYVPRGTLAVFAEVDVAVHEDALYRALWESRTWGELRRRLPDGEWTQIREGLPEPADDEEEDEGRLRWEDDATPFSLSQIGGAEDGEYPPVNSEWLGDADAFPNALVNAHNTVVLSTPYRAIHWHIPDTCAEAVADTLRSWGYVVEHTSFLEFC